MKGIRETLWPPPLREVTWIAEGLEDEVARRVEDPRVDDFAIRGGGHDG
jgi:hypothetical protein